MVAARKNKKLGTSLAEVLTFGGFGSKWEFSHSRTTLRTIVCSKKNKNLEISRAEVLRFGGF